MDLAQVVLTRVTQKIKQIWICLMRDPEDS